MDSTALALVLTGALFHALWNIAAKRASGGLVFVWLFGCASVVLTLPLALFVWLESVQPFNFPMCLAILASSLIHIGYSLVLQKAYQKSDFSVVYPIARGTGPLFSVVAAIILLHEHPDWEGGMSIALILIGLAVSAGVIDFFQAKSTGKRRLTGVLWGLATALFIAGYTTVDGWAIKSLEMNPILFYTMGLGVRAFLLTPFALNKREEIVPQIRAFWKEILIVGILSPLAYLLVLFALKWAPLSYVAPVREVSMMIGLFIGFAFLKEEIRLSQVIGALIMLAGVMGLAWS